MVANANEALTSAVKAINTKSRLPDIQPAFCAATSAVTATLKYFVGTTLGVNDARAGEARAHDADKKAIAAYTCHTFRTSAISATHNKPSATKVAKFAAAIT